MQLSLIEVGYHTKVFYYDKVCTNLNLTEEITMVGRVIGLVSCLMCAIPFLIISVYNKDSKEPINFWSGDTTLKSKVKNVGEYNKKMAVLYKR